MAETVYLAPDDEMASIKDKLDRAKGNPIILIAPKSVKALRNPLTSKLVQRHAEYLAKDVILVTHDRIARYLAKYHGLPACTSLTQVRRWSPRGMHIPTKGPAVPPDRQPLRLGMSGLATGFLAFMAVMLPLLVGYLVVPSATVTLFAATQTLSEIVAVTASVDAKTVDYQTGIIPARLVDVTMEVSDQTEVAGKRAVPDTPASGQVTFMNKVGTKVTVPKGTLLSTKSGVKFRTGDEVTLTTTLFSFASVGIIADQPGKAGNVDKQSIDQVLDPILATRVSVSNGSATQGGTDKEVGAVTAQDRSRLEAQALAKAKNDVFQKILTTKAPTESVYPQTINIQTINEQFDRKVGEETKTLSINLVVKGTALAFEARDVNGIVGKAVDKKVPNGMKIGADGVKIKPLGADNWSERSVSFHAQGDAKVITALDEEGIKRDIAGKSKEAAEKQITDKLALASRPDVKVEPGWAGDLPRFSWRIKINLRTP